MPPEYFDLKKAYAKFSDAVDTKSKLKEGAELVAQSVFNAGLFAARELPNAMALAVERQLKEGKNLPAEKREKMQDYVDRNKKQDR